MEESRMIIKKTNEEVTFSIKVIHDALHKLVYEIVENVIDELHKKGITIISITHNEEQSLRTANRRITIVDGQLAKEEVLI